MLDLCSPHLAPGAQRGDTVGAQWDCVAGVLGNWRNKLGEGMGKWYVILLLSGASVSFRLNHLLF